MESLRKPMGVLDNLPAEQREALEGWLFDEAPNLTYEEAKERLCREFQVTVSTCVLSKFYQRRARERMMVQILESARGSREVVAQCRENPSEAYEALMELIGLAAFDLRVAGKELSLGQLKDLAKVASVGLKARLEPKRVEISERSAASRERQAGAREREVSLKERVYEDVKAAAAAAAGANRESKVMTQAEVEEMVERANFM